MKIRLLALPGDGVGPEVLQQALRVLGRVAEVFDHELEVSDGLIGAAALAGGHPPLPAATLKQALEAPAVVLGAIGHPDTDDVAPQRRPEKALLELRRALGVFANLRPVRTYPGLLHNSPVERDRIAGTDLLIVRELTGGLYYGQPRELNRDADDRPTDALNSMRYTRQEVERVARLAFSLASSRRGRVTSVDKSNVLEVSQLWREVVSEVGRDFPGLELRHMLVDNCAMQLILDPGQFDVLLTSNLFGDILSDEAAVLAGSIGLLASASIGATGGTGPVRGLYEPVHGAASGLVGRNQVNPLATILSAALMLELSFGLGGEAEAVRAAVEETLQGGLGTPDLKPKRVVGTRELTEAVCAEIQ